MKKIEINNKKVGLALGGGATLGGVHIGVIKALDEAGIQIDYIAGTSIGSLVGAFFAFRKNYDFIQDIAVNMSWKDIASISISKYGLFANTKIEKLIEKYIGKVSFEEAEIPMAFVATDILNGEKVILQKGSVAKAVSASCCIPGVFHPIELENRLLVDGGLVENVPISPLKEMGAEFIIAVDLSSGSSYKKPDNFFDILMNSYQTSMLSRTKIQTRGVDLLITPKLDGFSAIDTDKTADLIAIGYNAGKQKIQTLLG
ncbi:MAG: patatin-like phospholipase family protein [Flavobacteriaceae bacterium]|nr:patatin-like phospholipase family protein [Flavobacteriaceae bacterium]